MADYIERNKAAEILCKAICGSDRALCVSTCKNCRQKQMLELQEIPATKVRQDVQGEWVAKQDVFQNTEKLAETAIRIILEKSEIFDLKTEYLPLMSALGKLLYYEDREK